MGNEKFDTEKAIELYKKGCTDKEIAKECHVCKSTITTWRHRNGFNTTHKKRIDYKKVRALYDNHMTDVEIAKTMNINSTSVFEWRKKNNLELNAIKIKALLMMRNL